MIFTLISLIILWSEKSCVPGQLHQIANTLVKCTLFFFFLRSLAFIVIWKGLINRRKGISALVQAMYLTFSMTLPHHCISSSNPFIRKVRGLNKLLFNILEISNRDNSVLLSTVYYAHLLSLQLDCSFLENRRFFLIFI